MRIIKIYLIQNYSSCGIVRVAVFYLSREEMSLYHLQVEKTQRILFLLCFLPEKEKRNMKWYIHRKTTPEQWPEKNTTYK